MLEIGISGSSPIPFGETVETGGLRFSNPLIILVACLTSEGNDVEIMGVSHNRELRSILKNAVHGVGVMMAQ